MNLDFNPRPPLADSMGPELAAWTIADLAGFGLDTLVSPLRDGGCAGVTASFSVSSSSSTDGFMVTNRNLN